MKRDWTGIAILALLCMLPGCREKPKPSGLTQPVKKTSLGCFSNFTDGTTREWPKRKDGWCDSRDAYGPDARITTRPRLESMVTPGIALTTRTDYADPYLPKITINWTVILSGIPTGCVIAGNAEGVPSGYVLRRSTHFYENSGPPDYWCNPKWKNKP